MRKSALQQLLITVIGVLVAMAILTAGGGAYLKWYMVDQG